MGRSKLKFAKLSECKTCNGTGLNKNKKTCRDCEGTGQHLNDENYDDLAIFTGDILYPDDDQYINFDDEYYDKRDEEESKRII